MCHVCQQTIDPVTQLCGIGCPAADDVAYDNMLDSLADPTLTADHLYAA